MKAEIHRMDLKFKELKKAQERLMREMEYSVIRRETIQNRNVSSNTAKAPTKGNFQKKMNDVRRSIRTLKNDVTQVDLEIVAFREKQSALSGNLQEIQLAISQYDSNKNELEEQIIRMKSQKQIVSVTLTRVDLELDSYFLELPRSSNKAEQVKRASKVHRQKVQSRQPWPRALDLGTSKNGRKVKLPKHRGGHPSGSVPDECERTPQSKRYSQFAT